MASVFLSHSSKDKPFVRELYRRLARDGVNCFFDEKSIEWGDNFVLALEQGIDDCEHLVLVLSPAFLASKWAEIERTSSMADNPDGLKRKVLPLTLVHCRQDPSFPRFLRQVQALDVSTDALFEEHYPKICRALEGTLHEDIELPHDRTSLPPVVDLPRGSWMPHRSIGDRFVGRVDPLWHVHDCLTAGKRAVVQGVGLVTGTGGLGKTQLAVEYAHRFAMEYPGGVFWIGAEQGLTQLVSIIAREVGIEVDGKLSLEDQLVMVCRGLNRPSASLVILDNFPETAPLQPWLPPSGPIHLLVTTRRRDLTAYPTVGLHVLSSDEGVQLLSSGQRRHTSEEARRLVHEVGGLPLALELLRDYLDSCVDVTPAMVVAEFKHGDALASLEEFAGEYRDELPTGHEKGVVKTFELSWALASEKAKRVLAGMALLAPIPVPPRLLRTMLDFPEVTPLRDPLQKSLTELRQLSLVDFDVLNDPFAHRLILGFVRHRGGVVQGLRAAMVDRVRREMERAHDVNDTESLRDLKPLLPHGFALLQNILRAKFASDKQSYPPGCPSGATDQAERGRILKDRRELQEARDPFQTAFTELLDKLAPAHRATRKVNGDPDR